VGKVIKLSDVPGTWDEVFTEHSDDTTLHVYRDRFTGRMEIVLVNGEGEAISKCLGEIASDAFHAVIRDFTPKKGA
jgi:hypothetical protein